jgi:cytochrome c6
LETGKRSSETGTPPDTLMLDGPSKRSQYGTDRTAQYRKSDPERRSCVMKKMFVLFSVFIVLGLVFGTVGVAKEAKKSGETLFKDNCAPCHPDGGNIVNPKKTLSKKDREANKIKKAADIIKVMRSPGQGMTKFDDKTIPDKEAKEIAEYIIKTFK